MSGIKYKSQINMPIPPTEDNHVLRNADAQIMRRQTDYEMNVMFDFLASRIRALGGSTDLAAPVVWYDAKDSLNRIMSSLGVSTQEEIDEAAAELLSDDPIGYQDIFRFYDISGNNRHSVYTSDTKFAINGDSGQPGAMMNSDTSLSHIELPCSEPFFVNEFASTFSNDPTNAINEALDSDNHTWLMSVSLRELNRRHNFLTTYQTGVAAARRGFRTTDNSWEFAANGRMRHYRGANPDYFFPTDVWQASLNVPMFFGMTSQVLENGTIEVHLYIDGMFRARHNYGMRPPFIPTTQGGRWLGNDSRNNPRTGITLPSIEMRGTIHSLRVYDKALSQFEILRFMHEEMEVYGTGV
jgi:hypothetical protein